MFQFPEREKRDLMSSSYGVYNTDIGFDFQINCLPNLLTLFIIHRFKEDLSQNPFQFFFNFVSIFVLFGFLLLKFSLLLLSFQ